MSTQASGRIGPMRLHRAVCNDDNEAILAAIDAGDNVNEVEAVREMTRSRIHSCRALFIALLMFDLLACPSLSFLSLRNSTYIHDDSRHYLPSLLELSFVLIGWQYSSAQCRL